MTLRFATAAVCGLVLHACVTSEDPERGTLEVSWTTGPTNCLGSGLDQVLIELDGSVVRSADCSDESAVIDDLDIGSRDLVLVGLDADDIPRYVAPPQTVRLIEGGVASADDVVLSALPARVDVTWFFTNGRLCSTNDVVDVEVSVWRDGFREATETRPCDDGAASLGGLSSGDFVVEVKALKANGSMQTEGATELTLGKGDRIDLEVPLAVDEDAR